MTNLNSLAADPAMVSNTTMSDIIDSLKRLERVGSETSKTTQKLIGAASDLAAEIIGYFDGCDDGTRIVRAEIEWIPNPTPQPGNPMTNMPRQKTPWSQSYMKADGRLCTERSPKPIYVAQNREAALAFSEDVASGLLDAITQRLEELRKESEDAMPKLEKQGKTKDRKLRRVRGGERLSGHREEGLEGFPEILIADGIGAGTGSLICAIESFHWADVVTVGDDTELRFEGRVPIVVKGGVVEYAG